MTSPIELVRSDLRDFAGYRSARTDRVDGDTWLNANESAWPNLADGATAVRRYPDRQPQALRDRLASLYGCAPDELLIGRGSDEAIDLLVRAICEPGQGAIVTTTPTFGMYAVSARLQGARVVDVPLVDDGETFTCDFDRVAAAALESGATLVFLCSPGNPTGNALALSDIDALAERLEGRALVVVDEAYQEFAATPSAAMLIASRANVAVLRTLSKAHALAGARIGSVIARAELIDVLRRCQAPYPLPTPCVELALRALSSTELGATRANTVGAVRERGRLLDALGDAPGVKHVYGSAANFLLVRFHDAEAAYRRLLDAGIVVRDMRAQPGLGDALRISIGRSEQNDRVIAVLRERVTA